MKIVELSMRGFVARRWSLAKATTLRTLVITAAILCLEGAPVVWAQQLGAPGALDGAAENEPAVVDEGEPNIIARQSAPDRFSPDAEEPPPGAWQRFKNRVARPFNRKKEEQARLVDNLVRESDGTWRVQQAEGSRQTALQSDYAAAQQLFRSEDYSASARAFKRLAKRYKDTPVEEDALYMQAESEFKLEKYPSAQDTYGRLMVKFPTTRYMPHVVQRTYDIAYYWLEDSRLRAQGMPTNRNAFTERINFFDKTRPVFDTPGRAIEAIDMLQQYDPLGPLTDDALMMAASHKFSNADFVPAAGYYEQIIADQPKSEHATKAIVLGAQAYLRAYEGPAYDGQDLESAHRLTKAALARSTALTADQQTRLEQDLRVIQLETAKRDFATAEQYRRLRKPTAARLYYQIVAENYPDTDFARQSTVAIQEIDADPEASYTDPISRLARSVKSIPDRFRTEEAITQTGPGEPAPAKEMEADRSADPDVEPSMVRPVSFFKRIFGSRNETADEGSDEELPE